MHWKIPVSVILAILVLGAKGSKNDDRLKGKWRSPAPVGADADGIRHEFFFEDKGKFLANRILYEFDEESETWSPYTAEQPANGYEDTWETRNGFLKLVIRERYITSRDQVFKYEISGDTLHLWKGEIFEGEGDQLTGRWKYEIHDESAKGKTFTRELEFHADGKFTEYFEAGESVNRYEDLGGHLRFIIAERGGKEFCPPDTVERGYQIMDEELYTWEPEEWMPFNRRP